MKGLAERNKMTIEQFHQHLRGSGVEPSTMRERFRAQFAWREVVRRRASMSVSITQRDVDRVLSSHGERGRRGHGRVAGAEAHPAGARQARSGRAGAGASPRPTACGRSSAAARPCRTWRARPPTCATRTSSTSSRAASPSRRGRCCSAPGMATCCRRRRRPTASRSTPCAAGAPIKADEKQREKAEGELAQKEYEIVAKRHLRDLRQDAHIEYR